MPLSKINRSSLNTGISDSSDATAVTINSSENITIGTSGTGASSTSPKYLSLGSTFSSVAGDHPKLKLYEASDGNEIGIGISSNQMDFQGTSTDFDYVFYGNGNKLMHVNGTGEITKPKQPCFRAQRQNASGGTQGFTTNITFNRQVIDLGNNYDPSNGRFTAPVDGTYYFTHGGLGASGTGASAHSSGYSWHVEFLKNAVRTGFQYYWYQGNPSAGGNQVGYINAHLDLLITLSANDYITVQLPDGTDSYYSDTSAHTYEAFFQGFLIA